MEELRTRRLPDKDDEINLLDYCRLIWKHRSLIASLWIASVIFSLIYSLLTPKIYVAAATILIPQEFGVGRAGQISVSFGNGAARGTDGGLGLLMDSAGGLSLTAPTPTRDTYLAILKSRTMREEVIGHFKKTWGPSVGSLLRDVDISASPKDGTMVVSAAGQDPKLAAEVANFYFENLSNLLARRGKNTASIQLAYFEKQLERTSQDLKEAQNALIEFQEKHRYIAISPATRSAIAMGAMQAGSAMVLEMERNLKRMYLTDQHPEIIALSRRIFESKRLLSHELYGDAQVLPPESPGAPPRKEFFVAKAKLTPLEFKLVDVFRNLKFREAISSFIVQNIESLKYTSENPAAVHIDWLDRAVPPGGPSKPNIRMNLLAAGVGSLIIGIFLAVILEYIERIKALERVRRAERETAVAPGP